MSAEKGFTLVELMVALAITALIGATSYAALEGVFQSRLAFAEKAEQLAQLQRFFTVIGRDIRMASGVENRGSDGEYEDTLGVTPEAETFFTLNRRGWHNPLLAPRSEMQRVYYRFDGDVVTRGHWESFDRIDDTLFRERPLLEGVREISLRALPAEEASDLDGEWLPQWPRSGEGLPAALELHIELEALGQFRRIYELLPQG